MSTSAVRTVCGSSARTDLCGGRSAMTVPTAIDGRKPRGDAKIELISPTTRSDEIWLRCPFSLILITLRNLGGGLADEAGSGRPPNWQCQRDVEQ